MKSQAHNGVAPLSYAHQHQGFQPLPKPASAPPYHKPHTSVPSKDGVGRFHVIGDTGGIKHPAAQQFVANAMAEEVKDGIEFCYHVGDVAYFNGEEKEYYSQFYEPYKDYSPTMYSIPGNHDGTPLDDTQKSLSGWCKFFMSGSGVDPLSQDCPRFKVEHPNVYWTLEGPATIVGLYSNIVEHGSIDSVQQQWFTHELATAPADKPLIVAMHHPVYSFDGHHSGSPAMADVLQHAINDTRRVPNMVLAGHVHNYQRITRTIGEHIVPFLVIGNGGYWHLHKVKDATVGTLDEHSGALLAAFDDTHHGYVGIEVHGDQIDGVYNSVDSQTGAVKREFDLFIVPQGCLKLSGTDRITL